MNEEMILVNKDFPLPKISTDNLVDVPKEISTGNYKLDIKTLKHFISLRKESIKLGVELLVDDGYRSLEKQKETYEKIKAENGKEYADKIVAQVGTSEHHTGLAIDLTLKVNNKILKTNDELSNSEIYFNKIYSLLPKHGFILRYPKNKEDITGYPYEPWHIRYIGTKNSIDMKNKNIKTLEEYIYPNIYTKKEKITN